MRSKPLFPAFALGAVLLCLAVLLAREIRRPAEKSERPAAPAVTRATDRSSEPKPASPLGKPLVATPEQSPEHPEEISPAQEAAAAEIDEASSTYSVEALPVLERYLNHADPQIRAAAADGLTRLGIAEGAPVLRKAAAQLLSTEPEEAARYQELADYLSLPDATAALVQKVKAAQAADGADPPLPPQGGKREGFGSRQGQREEWEAKRATPGIPPPQPAED